MTIYNFITLFKKSCCDWICDQQFYFYPINWNTGITENHKTESGGN